MNAAIKLAIENALNDVGSLIVSPGQDGPYLRIGWNPDAPDEIEVDYRNSKHGNAYRVPDGELWINVGLEADTVDWDEPGDDEDETDGEESERLDVVSHVATSRHIECNLADWVGAVEDAIASERALL